MNIFRRSIAYKTKLKAINIDPGMKKVFSEFQFPGKFLKYFKKEKGEVEQPKKNPKIPILKEGEPSDIHLPSKLLLAARKSFAENFDLASKVKVTSVRYDSSKNKATVLWISKNPTTFSMNSVQELIAERKIGLSRGIRSGTAVKNVCFKHDKEESKLSDLDLKLQKIEEELAGK